jgi:cytidyltransferase-like protein
MLIMDRDPQMVSSDIPVFGSTNESYQFPVVAMGGTFDHLHAGHKILLSCAAFLATSKLIVGMTSDSLLIKKRHVEILEHLDERTKKTREFLQLVKPGLELDLPPLTDIYGPTGWDPNVQALVVSKETLSGANASRCPAVICRNIHFMGFSRDSSPREGPSSIEGLRDRRHCPRRLEHNFRRWQQVERLED